MTDDAYCTALCDVKFSQIQGNWRPLHCSVFCFRFGSVFRNAIPPPRPYSPPSFEEIFGEAVSSTTTRRPEDRKAMIGLNLGLDKQLKHLKPEDKVRDQLYDKLSQSRWMDFSP